MQSFSMPFSQTLQLYCNMQYDKRTMWQIENWFKHPHIENSGLFFSEVPAYVHTKSKNEKKMHVWYIFAFLKAYFNHRNPKKYFLCTFTSPKALNSITNMYGLIFYLQGWKHVWTKNLRPRTPNFRTYMFYLQGCHCIFFIVPFKVQSWCNVMPSCRK
jgi:hypothetical protein